MSRNISRLLLVLGLLVASAASAWAEDIAVKVLQKEGVGSYLADGKGLTLYYFTIRRASPCARANASASGRRSCPRA